MAFMGMLDPLFANRDAVPYVIWAFLPGACQNISDSRVIRLLMDSFPVCNADWQLRG